LEQKQRTPFLLGRFTDLGCRGTELIQSAQKPSIGFVFPSNVPAPPPATPPKPIKPSVIADAGCGVSLDRITAEFTEARPPIQEQRIAANNMRHRIASLLRH
jgi:hypothetical protein